MKNSPDCTIFYARFLQSKLCLSFQQEQREAISVGKWAVGSLEQQLDYLSFEKALEAQKLLGSFL